MNGDEESDKSKSEVSDEDDDEEVELFFVYFCLVAFSRVYFLQVFMFWQITYSSRVLCQF